MISDFIVVVLGALLLWLWCRRDARRIRITEDERQRKAKATLRAISADVDKLIELEISTLPPGEQRSMRAKTKAGQTSDPA